MSIYVMQLAVCLNGRWYLAILGLIALNVTHDLLGHESHLHRGRCCTRHLLLWRSNLVLVVLMTNTSLFDVWQVLLLLLLGCRLVNFSLPLHIILRRSLINWTQGLRTRVYLSVLLWFYLDIHCWFSWHAGTQIIWLDGLVLLLRKSATWHLSWPSSIIWVYSKGCVDWVWRVQHLVGLLTLLLAWRVLKLRSICAIAIRLHNELVIFFKPSFSACIVVFGERIVGALGWLILHHHQSCASY